MKYILCGAILCVFSSTTVLANSDFNKVGEGKMEYLLWDVYDATLSTHSGNYALGDNPVKFKLTYLRNFEAKDIVKATQEQWQRLGKEQSSKTYSDKLLQIWPDIKKGESLTLITNEQGGSIFYHNDKKIGEINEPEFATDFLAIWLDKNTSEPELRKQLLGN